MYCLLDGLDECDRDSRRWLVKKLTSLRSSMLRLAVVSRPEVNLENFAQIRLDPDNNKEIGADILQVVSTGLEELWAKIPRFEEIKDNVKSKLLKRADGTFLWIGFAMRELLECEDTTEILRRIQDLPQGLNLLYSHMLLRIKEEHRSSTALILRWVAMADRPLSLDQIGAILGMSVDNTIGRDRALEDKVRVCQPFIRWVEQQHGSRAVLSLVHMSARDYLLRKHFDNNPVLESFRVKSEETHLEMAEFCLDQILDHGPLRSYARFSWNIHTAKACAHAEALFERRRDIFGEPFERQDAFWSEVEPSYSYQGVPPPLHLACEFSLPAWAHKIIAENWWKFDSRKLYTQTYQGEPALFEAVREKWWAVVDSMLAQGADLDWRDEEGATLLMRLASEGLEDSVEHLLARGASMDVQDHSGRTALRWATDHWENRTIGLLLERGARADIQSSSRRTALHQAARIGRIDIVKLLLEGDRGREIDIAEKNRFGALDQSARHWHFDQDVVRKALELFSGMAARTARLFSNRGAISGNGNRTLCAAFREAIELGGRHVLRLFLNRSEHDDTSRSREYTAIQSAAKLGREDLIHQLLDRRPKLTARKHAESVLDSAAEEGDLEIVCLLLEQGAKTYPNTETSKSVLHVASEWGRLSVLRLLLSRGADANAKEKTVGTALHCLAHNCYQLMKEELMMTMSRPAANRRNRVRTLVAQVVSLLVMCGADLNARDGDGRTASDIAKDHDRLWLVDILNESAHQPKLRRSRSLSDTLSLIPEIPKNLPGSATSLTKYQHSTSQAYRIYHLACSTCPRRGCHIYHGLDLW